jgi:hypothetical protein
MALLHALRPAPMRLQRAAPPQQRAAPAAALAARNAAARTHALLLHRTRAVRKASQARTRALLRAHAAYPEA